MMKKIIYLTLVGLFICCKADDTPDCSAVLCLTPSVTLNLVDDTTKENTIIQNSIKEENITVYDASNNHVEFIVNEDNGLLIIDKNNNIDTLKILIDSNLITSFSYETSNPQTNECCDFGELTNILVDNKTFTIEDSIINVYL